MTLAYVALGGNVGDRQSNLETALALIREGFEIVGVSPLYETAPDGFSEQPPFLNAAVAIETGLTPREMLAVLQKVEARLGKATPFPNGPRTIDIDLLLYGDEIVDEPDLTVPHPRMHRRRFVLVPLADIAPDAIHPALRRTVSELLAALPAQGDVTAYPSVSRAFSSSSPRS